MASQFRDISRLLHRKWILTAVACVAVWVYVISVEVAPKYGQAAALHREWQEQRQVVEGIQLREQNLVHIAREKQRLIGELQSVMVQLARQDEMSAITLTLHDALPAGGAALRQIKPLEARRGDPYDVLPLEIEVEGDFHGIASFVSRLEQAPYLIKIHQLSLESGRSESILARVALHVVTAGTGEETRHAP